MQQVSYNNSELWRYSYLITNYCIQLFIRIYALLYTTMPLNKRYFNNTIPLN